MLCTSGSYSQVRRPVAPSGVSALSVYKWESGKTRPRARQLEAIASLRKMGKREAQARLAG